MPNLRKVAQKRLASMNRSDDDNPMYASPSTRHRTIWSTTGPDRRDPSIKDRFIPRKKANPRFRNRAV